MATPAQSEDSNLIAGRFQLIRKLGEGGYGAVYEAIDRESRARVALKTLQRMDPDALLRFKEEFRSLQDIEHTNLVHLSELMCADGLWFFTMELIEGTDFLEYVRHAGSGRLATGPIDLLRLRRALVQLVHALTAVHGSGRVHCDIKPSNIRIDTSGRLVLLDFGLITVMAGARTEDHSDGVLGTPAYMAPEQCRGESVTPASDLYAVGILLYEALAGVLPFSGHVARILVDKQQREALDPRTVDPHAPDDLALLCMELTRLKPEARPTNAALLGMLLADNDALTSDVLALDGPGRQAHTAEGPPFIGRGEELDSLRRHYARTRRGRPAIAYISGESGVGKTALARTFVDELRDRDDAIVFRSRCYERETVPYKAFDGIVDDLARYLGRLDPRKARTLLPLDTRLLVPIFPVLSSVKPLVGLPATRPPRDPNVLRAQAFAALREILARLALERPLVLFIDDLQWTDVDSLSLMDEMFGGPEAPGCMVVATGRPLGQLADEIADGLLPLLSAEFSREVPLSGLTTDEAEQLMRVLAHGPNDSQVFRRIAEETKGHPLFVAELLRHVEAGHALVGPRQLDEAIRERVHNLSEQTRELLELLAAASTPTSHRVLAQILTLDLTDLGRRLAQLRAAHLVRSEDRKRVECYHDRVRNSVLEGLSPDVKRKRHRDLASALSQLKAADPEQIAYQWRNAGDDTRAARYYAEAADVADRALAFNRAARLYDEALTNPRAFEASHLAKLRVSHARALSCAGFSARAAEVYLEASKAFEGAEARMLRRRATQLMLRSGRITEGLALADEVLGEVGLTRPRTPTRAVLRLAWERTRLAVRGLDYTADDSQKQSLDNLDLLWAVAPSLAFVDVLGGSALQSMYARLALSSGNAQHVVRSLTVEAMLRSTAEIPPQPRVTSILARVRQVAETVDAPYHKALLWMSHGYVHWVNFRNSESLSSLAQAEKILRESCVDVAWELTNVRAGLLSALWNHGRLAQHEEMLSEWQRDARERGDLYASTQLVGIGLSYFAHLRRNDPDAAALELRESLASWPASFQLPHMAQFVARVLVGTYRANGEAYRVLHETWPQVVSSRLLNVPYLAFFAYNDAAWACLDEATRASGTKRRDLTSEALDFAQRLSRTRWSLSSALVDHVCGQASLLAGRPDEAQLSLRRSLDALESEESCYQHPVAFLLGAIVGGEEGRTLQRRALTWAKHEGVREPELWFSMFAPVIRLAK